MTTTTHWATDALHTFDVQTPQIHPALHNELEFDTLRDLLVRFTELPAGQIELLQKPTESLLERLTPKLLDGISRRRVFLSETEAFYKEVRQQLGWKRAGSLVRLYSFLVPGLLLLGALGLKLVNIEPQGLPFLPLVGVWIGQSIGKYFENRLERNGRLFGEVEGNWNWRNIC